MAMFLMAPSGVLGAQCYTDTVVISSHCLAMFLMREGIWTCCRRQRNVLHVSRGCHCCGDMAT